MATSLPLPDGGQSSAATHRNSAPKISARKKAASEATQLPATNGRLPRSKKSAGLPPSVSLKADASNGGGLQLDANHAALAPSEDSSGQYLNDAQTGFAGEGGHSSRVSQRSIAAQDLAGQTSDVNREPPACNEEGLSVSEALQADALLDLLSDIKQHHSLRCDYQRARTRLELQLLAMCRRTFEDGDKEKGRKLFELAKKGKADMGFAMTVAPMLAALELVSGFEKQKTKALQAATDGLPEAVLLYADNTRGFGRLGLAQILGETGDLSMYANPGKVWKRMGLAVFDGKSQRRTSDKEKAIEQGYSPARRSIMHVIGVSLVMQNKDYLREVYDAEKARQEQLYPHLTKMHRDRKARRYMQKRLLRDLWRVWRGAAFALAPIPEAPPSEPSGDGGGPWTVDAQTMNAAPIPETEATL